MKKEIDSYKDKKSSDKEYLQGFTSEKLWRERNANLINKAMDNKGIMILGADIQLDGTTFSSPKIYNTDFDIRRDFITIKENPDLKSYYHWCSQQLLVINGSFELMNEEVEC